MMFTYYLRKALRDKGFIFWSLAFPFLLMLCFNVTFKGPAKGEVDFNPVKSSVIVEGESAFTEEFQTVYYNLCDADYVKNSNMGYNHEILENVPVSSMEEAEKKVLDNDLEVIFIVNGQSNSVDVKVGDDAATTTLMVARSIAESFRKNYAIMTDAAAIAPERIEQVIESLSDSLSVMKAKGTYLASDGSSANMYDWYYYSTVVMGMCFNVSAGVHSVFDIQADLSPTGMRSSISPKKKWKILLSAFSARYVMVMAISIFHVFCLNKVFEIPVGNRIVELGILITLGNLFCMSLGSLFGLFTKGDENSRDGKSTGFVMISVFLSGEMIVVIPGLIEKYCPIINRINPATLMNFAFYRLVNYPTLDGFWLNMIKIAVATVVFLTIAILKLRREKYAAL